VARMDEHDHHAVAGANGRRVEASVRVGRRRTGWSCRSGARRSLGLDAGLSRNAASARIAQLATASRRLTKSPCRRQHREAVRDRIDARFRANSAAPPEGAGRRRPACNPVAWPSWPALMVARLAATGGVSAISAGASVDRRK
jgi:hypothetical protein